MRNRKYLISNVVYGDLYFKIFVERHLRSVLDETNLPAIAAQLDITYRIYTDAETKEKIENHPITKRLASIAKIDLVVFEFNDPTDKFGARYGVLTQSFHETVEWALKNNFELVTFWVADLVVAREFFPRIMNRINGGHDAVFVLPLRSAYESTSHIFMQVNRALTDLELFKIGFINLHPLWIACHWGNPSFTRMPYSLLWRSAAGLMARSFSVTPIIFEPHEDMLKEGGMIDGDVPAHFKNPYWCEDWIDAPVIGVEPLFCHYPPFHTRGCKTSGIRKWANRKENPPIHPSQKPYLKKHLYYPSKKLAKIGLWQRIKSNTVVRKILL